MEFYELKVFFESWEEYFSEPDVAHYPVFDRVLTTLTGES